MATISTLAVNLIARTSAFEKGMGRSRKRLSFVQRQAMATRAAILSMAKGMIFAAGVGGMGILIKRSFDTIDAVAKMSDRLGIATEDIIAFGHAAKITGMDTAGMNKALETFVRRIGEVRLGTGQAKVALEKLGLTADELANQKLADNFQLIAEKISKMENASDKAATAYFLFGRQGQQMLNFLNMGARGLDVFRAEVDRLGLSFSRLDAAKVEMANDAMVRLKARFTGLAQTAAIQLAPVIDTIAVKLTEMGASGVNAQAAMVLGFEALTVRAAHFANFMKRTGAAFQFAAGGVLGFFAPLGLLGKGGRDNIAAISKTAKDMRDAAAAVLMEPFDPGPIRQWFADVEMRAAEATRNIAKSAIAELPEIATAAEDQVKAVEKALKAKDTSGMQRPSFPQTSDFGELTSPDVSIKGLSIGAADGGIRSELQKQTGYLALIASKEALG